MPVSNVSKEKKEPQAFKLLVGIHIGPDLTQEPVDVVDANTGRVVGKKYPSKTYTKGQTVLSETDLVENHGSEKFAYSKRKKKVEGESTTPGDPTPKNLKHSPSVTPDGRVQTGKQSSTSVDTGKGVETISGPADPEDDKGQDNKEDEKPTTPSSTTAPTRTPQSRRGPQR